MGEIVLGKTEENPRFRYSYGENLHIVLQDFIAKMIAYQERFGQLDDSQEADDPNCLLPISVCREELKRAEYQLLYEGKRVNEVKMVPFDDLSGENGGFEINVNGRRFSIPRDSYIPFYEQRICSVETAVVSVYDESKWPESLEYDVTPKISKALQDIATGPLIHDIRDLAVYLQLGDRIPFAKNNLLQKEVFQRAKEKFGIDDILKIREILKSIGLRIVDTSTRISEVVSLESSQGRPEEDDRRSRLVSLLGLKAMFVASRSYGQEGAYGTSARTEVDALLEAIHKTVLP